MNISGKSQYVNHIVDFGPIIGLVKSYWYFETTFTEAESMRFLPRPFPFIIISLSDKSLMQFGDQQKLVNATSVGLMYDHDPLTVIYSGNVRHVGVEFHPNAISYLLNDAAHIYTNNDVDLEQILDPNLVNELKDSLAKEVNILNIFHYLNGFFSNKIFKNYKENYKNILVKNAINYLSNNINKTTIDVMSREIGTSKRNLDRIFLEQVGVSAKVWSDSFTFQTLYKDMQGRQLESLELYAEKWGFTDASHLCKFYKRKTGTNPKNIIVRRNDELLNSVNY
jgi:AraC-like DNA-binding protein